MLPISTCLPAYLRSCMLLDCLLLLLAEMHHME
jgi:hypothetical protein